MIDPSDLEGEVDHSFFDSDCDRSSEHGKKKKVEKGVKADKESPSLPEGSHMKLPEDGRGALSPKTAGRERRPNQLQENNISSSKAGRKESSRSSSVSSVSCTPHKVITDSSDSEDDFDLHSRRPKGKLLSLLADTRHGDGKDVSSQSPNDTEEEVGEFNKTLRRKSKHSPKKPARNLHTRSLSPSSTETSADADLDSSCSSSSSRRSSLESPTLPTPNQVTRTRLGSAGPQQSRTPPADESDSTVTDVSPLVSPHSSPLQSLDCNPKEAEEGCQEGQQEDCVPSSGQSNMNEEEDSDQDVDDYSLTLEGQVREKLVVHCPGRRNRKNYSFTNEEVRRIDRENQRLLRELSRHSPGPRSESAMTKKSHAASTSRPVRISHSALNRQREQQRIERENLSFLKRLQSVKPTPGLRRSDQLADYQRSAGYLGAPLYPVCSSSTKRASSRTPSAGLRSVSSRAAFTASDSSSTPVPRPRKVSAARPAWC